MGNELAEAVLLDTVLAHAPVGIAFLDRELRFVRVNDTLAELNGIPAEEHVGRALAEVWPEVPAALVGTLRRVLDTGESVSGFEVRRQRRGRVRHVLGNYGPVVGPDGSVSGVGIVVVDITSRTLAEEALRSSDRRLRDLLDNVQLIAVSLDLEGRITFANPFLSELTGWAREELEGRGWYETFTPPELMHLKESFLEALPASAVPSHSESAILTRAGERRLIAWNNTVLREPDGEIVGATSLGIDVTDERRAEERLRALARVAVLVAAAEPAETVFRAVAVESGCVLDARSSAVIRYGDDDTATVVGRWDGSGLGGFPEGAVLPVAGDGILPTVRRTGLPHRVDDYRTMEGEVAAMMRKLGVVSVVGAPITVGGAIWGILAVATDGAPMPPDTDGRLADFAELIGVAVASADARAELGRSRARIVESADAARRRLERDLHDGAQQRLVSLALTLRLAEARLDSGDAGELLAQAREELDQALDELRELARGIHPAVLSDLGLRPALETLAARSPFPVRTSVSLAERPPSAVEIAVYYVASEALANAAKHAVASSGSIDVRRENGCIVLEVADDGRGGASLNGGSGLPGLVDRVEALGGTLALESRPGDGTRIRVGLPV